jgi:general secretion pathway protein K
MKSRSSQQGFALVIVLWTMALLALLLGILLAGARTEVELTTSRRDEAVASAAADGAIAATVLDLLRAPAMAPPGRRRIGAAAVAVTLENLSGRINPNIVSAETLRALLVLVGAGEMAERLAAAIVDWRTPGLAPSPHGAKRAEYQEAGRSYGPPGRPFEHLSELGAVLGMTPAVLVALLPHLTLWSTTDPDPAFADAVVLTALRMAGVPSVAAGATDTQVIAITATATIPAGAHSVRRAVVRFGYSPDGRRWRVLAWDDGEAG